MQKVRITKGKARRKVRQKEGKKKGSPNEFDGDCTVVVIKAY